jgi:hypothetical protein
MVLSEVRPFGEHVGVRLVDRCALRGRGCSLQVVLRGPGLVGAPDSGSISAAWCRCYRAGSAKALLPPKTHFL